jgi:amino acid transporter
VKSVSESKANGDAEQSLPSIEEYFAFAGRGHAEQIVDLDTSGINVARHRYRKMRMLGEWRSTAICGNDITSSVLYVSALCAAQAGMLAPIVLLLVGVLLYLYRRIYGEVGSALPLNGGTYTLLLNSTNKRFAAVAAGLTLLSYAATAVVSATDAMHYAHDLAPRLTVLPATLGVLVAFALLNLLGLRESSSVALGIFVLHIATLVVLAASGIVVVLADPSLFAANWALPPVASTGHALFFGFAAAMLGISGFESSANFIEEQKRGVFPQTLRNMWIAVIVFNPLVSLLSFGLLPRPDIEAAPPDLLAQLGQRTLGGAFSGWVSLDATLVLCGAVLTSFVGVNGLVRRMALDQCLPQFLLAENRWRETNHWIILGFAAVCASILFVTQGNLADLGGVYTLAFLSVMALYAVGNMLLKVRRSRLPRAIRAGWPTLIVAIAAVGTGLVGNIMLSPHDVGVFALYYGVVVALIAAVFLRIQAMKVVFYVSRSLLHQLRTANDQIGAYVMRKVDEISRRPVAYFVGDDDLVDLNRAVLYVVGNEQTRLLKMVHVYEKEGDIPPRLREHVEMLDHLYPQIRIDFVAVHGSFGPELVESLSTRLGIPKNMMFMGTPGGQFPHEIDTLGGVRVII